MTDLGGKTALVTGGNSGIGLAAARALHAAGARVAISGRDAATLRAAAESVGPGTLGISCDISRLADLDSLYARIGHEFGMLDILFANAGISKPTPLASITEAQFDELFDTNAKGTFFTVQKALPLLRDGGSIILNASIAPLTGAPGFAAYGASKGAVRAMARMFSAELAPRRIRANLVTPGPIATNIWTRYDVTPEAMTEAETRMLARVPARRLGTAEELARAVLFLASDASSYMLGAELVIDGGVSHLSAAAPGLA